MDARNSNYIQELTKMIADLRQESYKQLQRIEALEAAQQQPADHIPDATKMVAPPAPPAPAVGLVKRLSHLLAKRFSESRPGTDCTPFACDVLREIAAATDQMAPDRNLTWERVALWLEREANR